MSLPPNVSFFMSRLQGVSTSHYKIFGQTGTTASANKIIRFELPSASMVNLKSLRLVFNAAMTSNGGRLPNKISSLVQRVALYAGGVAIANPFDHYNLLVHAKDSLCGDKSDAATSHPEIVRAKSYHDGSDLSASNAKEAYDTGAIGEKQFVLQFSEGVLDSLAPSLLDLSILPQVTLEIHLAENNVCPCVSSSTLSTNGIDEFCTVNAASPVYELSNISLQIEVLGFASSVIDELTEQRISSVGYVSLPFKNYFSHTSQHQNVSRFNVNTASLDRMWIVWRATTYSEKAAPKIVEGYKIGSGTGTPRYDAGGVLDTNKEKYISKYFQMSQVPDTSGSPITFSLQVNGASIPSFKCTTTEMYSITKNSLDLYHTNTTMSLDQYRKDFFVQCMRFCLPESDLSRMATGLDSRSTSANFTVETSGIDSCNLTVYFECSSELRIGSGKAIEIVA